MSGFPSFIARLARPFTQSTRLSVAPESSSSAPGAVPEGAQRCTVAAGCFWGTEHLYRRHFAGKGLLDAKVGYIGGDLSDPTYRAVCGGKTGRASCLSPSFSPLTKINNEIKKETNRRVSPPQTPKPRKSSSTRRRSRTASCSSSSTRCTTRRRSTPRAPTRGRSTGPPSTSTMPSRRRWRGR